MLQLLAQLELSEVKLVVRVLKIVIFAKKIPLLMTLVKLNAKRVELVQELQKDHPVAAVLVYYVFTMQYQRIVFVEQAPSQLMVQMTSTQLVTASR